MKSKAIILMTVEDRNTMIADPERAKAFGEAVQLLYKAGITVTEHLTFWTDQEIEEHKIKAEDTSL